MYKVLIVLIFPISIIDSYVYSQVDIQEIQIIIQDESERKKSRDKLIYITDSPTFKNKVPEISYDSKVLLLGLDGAENIISPEDYLREIEIRIIDKRGLEVLEAKENHFGDGKTHPFRLNRIMKNKDKVNELGRLIDGKAIVKITDKNDKKYEPITLSIKHFKTHFLVDLEPVEGNEGFLPTLGTFFTQSLFKSQISLSYLASEDLDSTNSPIIFSVPVLKFDSQNFITKNLELGFSVPVNNLDNIRTIGWGANIGFGRLSIDRTALQFGGGRLTENIGEQTTKGDWFWYIGFDIVTFLSWLNEVL